MSIPQPSTEKPGLFMAVGIITIVSGVINILYGLGLTVAIVLGTLGIGLLCAPLTILPAVLGIFEILYGVKLLANPPRPPLQPSQAIAVMEVACILTGNVLSTVAGILALVFYGDPAVKAYFAKINSGSA